MEETFSTFSYEQLKQFCRDKKLKGFSKYTNKKLLKEFILRNVEDEEDTILYNNDIEHQTPKINIPDVIPRIIHSDSYFYRKLLGTNVSLFDGQIEHSEVVSGTVEKIIYKVFNISCNIKFQDKDSIIVFNENTNRVYIYTEDKEFIDIMYYRSDSPNVGYLKWSNKTFIFKETMVNENLQFIVIGFFIPTTGWSAPHYSDNSLANLNMNLLDYYFTHNKRFHQYQKYDIEVIPYSRDYEVSRYNHYKKYFQKKIGLFQEKILFHGTSKQNLQSILDIGLTLTNKPIHGSAFGNGVYFTDKLELALKYPKLIGIEERYVIVCMVGVNNIIEGKKALQNFPMKPNSHIPYDTGVDKIENPSQFIKKDIDQFKIIGYFKIIVPLQYNTSCMKLITIQNNTDKSLCIFLDKDKRLTRSTISTIVDDPLRKRWFKRVQEIGPGRNYRIKSIINNVYFVGYYNNDRKFLIKDICVVGTQNMTSTNWTQNHQSNHQVFNIT